MDLAQAPAAAQSLARTATGITYDPGFLSVSAIGDYLRHVAANPAHDPKFAVFAGPLDAASGRYPLLLCEFLAYKTVLAYEADATIRDNLAGCKCHGIDVDNYRFFDSRACKRGDSQGFGFVIGDTAFIIMRGTTSLADWIDDLAARSTDSRRLSKKTLALIGEPLPPRHLGFSRAWANVAGEIEKWLHDLEAKGVRVGQFCFSGHSLGGALAQVGAYEFARKGRTVAGVVTFAAPKIGGSRFAQSYNDEHKLGARTIRMESPEDLITWVAPSRDYTPVGARWPVDKRPMIKGADVFWAALFGIAGWQDAGPSASPSFSPSSSPSPAGTGKKEEPGSTPAAGKEAGKEAGKAQQGDLKELLRWIAIAAVVVMVFLVARKAIIRYRAHGVSKRYSLYLSTLAYQQIRAFRGTDYDGAIRDLDAHLAFIRGKDERDRLFRLKGLPVRVTTKNAEALAAKIRENGPYKHYFY